MWVSMVVLPVPVDAALIWLTVRLAKAARVLWCHAGPFPASGSRPIRRASQLISPDSLPLL